MVDVWSDHLGVSGREEDVEDLVMVSTPPMKPALDVAIIWVSGKAEDLETSVTVSTPTVDSPLGVVVAKLGRCRL